MSTVPANTMPPIRREVLGLDPNQPVYNVKAMNQVLEDSVTERRFNMTLLAAFASTALLLACSGILGVMAYIVAQRRIEIGIRMALGARRADVLKLILWRGMRLALAGWVLSHCGGA